MASLFPHTLSNGFFLPKKWVENIEISIDRGAELETLKESVQTRLWAESICTDVTALNS